MKLICLESTDSTNTEVARVLKKQNLYTPIAVMAKSQTKGKGSGHKSWASPTGGLYLSLSCAVDETVPITLYPTKTALVIAMWLLKEFSIRTTLKWPNDLLYAGRKLVGVLCESSYSQNSWSPVIIGIGINIKPIAQPTLKPKHLPIGLEELNVFANTPEDLAKSLLDFWQLNWSNIDVEKQYDDFQPGPGHIWNFADNVYHSDGISSEGSLLLSEIEGDGKKNVVSSSQDLQWVHTKKIWFIADFGNTAIKIARFCNNTIEKAVRIETNTPLCIDEFREKTADLWSTEKAENTVYAISVNKTNYQCYQALIEQMGYKLFAIPKRTLRVRSFYNIKELGEDRLAHLEYCIHLKELSTYKATILVNCGTATVIEVLTNKNEHLGGYILPGLKTSLNALNNKTHDLPLCLPKNETPMSTSLPLSTADAILQGVYGMTLAMIENLKVSLSHQLSCSDDAIAIVFTGGLGKKLSSSIPRSFYHEEMVLRGGLLMVQGGIIE